jgi:DNA polymerase III epsilon subunit family exonuclease
MEILLVVVGVAAVLLWLATLGKRGAARHPPRDRRRAIESLLPARFIVADLETTGLDPDTDRIIEIGAIRVNRDSDMHETFTVLVHPGRKLPAKIVEITGITDSMLEQDGCDIARAMGEFLDFVGEDMLVFYKAEFDIAFLTKAAQRISRRIPNKVCCALEAARVAWPGRASYKLVDLSEDHGLGTDGAHRALVDCQRTAMIYAKAVALSGRIGHLQGRSPARAAPANE